MAPPFVKDEIRHKASPDIEELVYDNDHEVGYIRLDPLTWPYRDLQDFFSYSTFFHYPPISIIDAWPSATTCTVSTFPFRTEFTTQFLC